MMRYSTGLTSHLLLSSLTLLSGGAIVLSLVTAPPVAQTQLRGAAKNTLAASSFTLTEVFRVSAPSPTAALGGKSSETSEALFGYQAPDRVADYIAQPSKPTVTVLAIGAKRYYRNDGGAWTPLPAERQGALTIGSAEGSALIFPIQGIAGATSVTRQGSSYQFVPQNEGLLIERLFRQAPSALSNKQFTAVVSGDFITSEIVTADRAPYHFVFELNYSSVDHLAPIDVPTAAQITP